MNKINALFCSMILMLLWGSKSWAQFNPPNPQEPSIQYKIELECSPAEIAELIGGGQYEDGSSVFIDTYAYNGNYEFQYWEHNGEVYSRNSNILFKISTRDERFIAHYQYKPYNPEEPNARFMRRIFIKTQPEGVASFYFSNGEKYEVGSNLQISESDRVSGYKFQGWYDGDELIGNTLVLDYTVPDRDVTLVARYEFNPGSPDDPSNFYSESCHTLIYMLQDQVYASFVKETGDSIATIPDAVMDGYVFLGWQDVPEIMPDEDLIISAAFKLSNIRVSQPSININGGDKLRVKAFVGSASMDEVKDVLWTIDDESIATVSSSGVLKGIKKGTTVITASYIADAQVFASASVNVGSDLDRVDLPSLDFEFNYNAENYDAENIRIENDPEAILCDNYLQLSGNAPVFVDNNRLSITQLCKGYIDKWDLESTESGQYFKRSGDDCLTIVCKVKPRYDNSTNKSDLISLNSSSNTNYSLRIGYKNAIYLETSNTYTNRFLNYKEDMDQVFAVKVGNGGVIILNLTTGESKVLDTNTWGGTAGAMNFFYSNASNYFTGDFCWVYLAKDYLSDSEIWDVVDFNERVDKDSIPDVLLGDANNSGTVNVTDITTVADYLFGNYPSIYNFKASDVNLSRSVNVADIAGIVNVIYGGSFVQNSPVRNNGETVSNGVELSDLQIAQGEEGEITVSVKNTSDISAVEMNLRLPQGLTVIGSEIDADRAGKRTFRSGYVNGVYKLVTYSTNNEPLQGNEGVLFTIKVKASDDIQASSFNMSLTDVVFSRNGNEVQVPSVNQTFDVALSPYTNVASETVVMEIRTYDLLGREVDPESAKSGPYIVRELIDGKSVRTYKVIR